MTEQKKSLRQQYRETLKSEDTEEWFDLVFHRPLGFAWACLAKKLHISPNAITIASIFLGLGAAALFWFDNMWYNIAGAVLLLWADTFDSADGQLARMTKQYSRIGRILDGVSGDIWFAAIYSAICLRVNATSEFFGEWPWLIWAVAVVTGVFHGIQAAMADYYRQFHFFFLKGKEGSELDTAADLWQKFHAMSWRKDFFAKFTLMFYTNYTVGQEKRTPAMQRLRRTLHDRFGSVAPESFRQSFRAASRPLMKYTNILSFNTRCFALFAAIIIFRMPWLYFAFELTVLNAFLIYMIWRHERICREMTRRVENGDFR